MTIVIPVLVVKIFLFYVLGFVFLLAREYIGWAAAFVFAFLADFVSDLADKIKSTPDRLLFLAWLLYPCVAIVLLGGKIIEGIQSAALSVQGGVHRWKNRKMPQSTSAN